MAHRSRRCSMDSVWQRIQTAGDKQDVSRGRDTFSVGGKMSKDTGRVSDICQLASMAGNTNIGSDFNQVWQRQMDDIVAPNTSSGEKLEGKVRNGRLGSSHDVPTNGCMSQDPLKCRMIYQDNGKHMSPWHAIPLHFQKRDLVNCICKTPAHGLVRYEIAQDEPLNPLRQARQTATGKPAFYADNCPWNIGFLPQTWAAPELLGIHLNDTKKYRFDNCPVEVVEVGEVLDKSTGDVYAVKPLAAFLLLEGGASLSWKVVTIAVDDPLSDLLHNIADLKTLLPGTLCAIRDWLRTRLCTEPGMTTSFPFGDEPIDASEATRAIARAHAAWETKVAHRPLDPSPLLHKVPHDVTSLERVWTTHIGEQNTVANPQKASPTLAWTEFATAEDDRVGTTLSRTSSCPLRIMKVAADIPPCDPDASSLRFSFQSSWSSSSSHSSISTAMTVYQSSSASISVLQSVSDVLVPKSPACAHSPLLQLSGDPQPTKKAGFLRRARSLFAMPKVLGMGNRSHLSRAAAKPAAQPPGDP